MKNRNIGKSMFRVINDGREHGDPILPPDQGPD